MLRCQRRRAYHAQRHTRWEVCLHLDAKEEAAVKRRVTRGLLWVLFVWATPLGSHRLSHSVHDRAYKKFEVIANESNMMKKHDERKEGQSYVSLCSEHRIAKPNDPE